MKKNQYSRLSLIACIAFLAASVQVHANMAEASGMLADMHTALAVAAKDMAGDPSSAAAQDRVSAIKDNISEAEKAYEKLKAANGNDPAAMDALIKARQQALGEGAVPQATSAQPYRPPNIFDVPWRSDAQREISREGYQVARAASPFGGNGYAERDERERERDATPE